MSLDCSDELKRKVVCFHCKDVVNTTIKVRDVPFSDGISIVKNLPVGVCDICDNVVFTPSSSTEIIKKSFEERNI